jgi:tetratricopeptide (TPR) repeat protein
MMNFTISFIIHHSSFIIHHSSFIIHHLSFIIIKNHSMTDNSQTGIRLNVPAPPMPPHFGTSRDSALHALHQTLFIEQTPVLMLSGFAGVGKTALATAYVNHYGKCFENIIWLNVLISIEEAVLNHCYRPNPKEILDSTLAPTLVNDIYSTWNQAEGRNLLILDGVNQLQQIQNLPHLSAQWSILCVSRLAQAPATIPVQKLGTLSAIAAQTLFLKCAPAAQSEMTVLQKLLQSIDYQPFIIKFLAHNFQTLRNSNPRYRLADWHQNLAQQQLLQLGKYAKIVDYDAATTAEKQAKIEDIIKFVYQLKVLTAVEKQYLTQIAYTMHTWFTTELLCTWLGMNATLNQKWLRETESALKLLVQKGWLEMESIDNQSVVFKINGVIQTIIVQAKPLEAPIHTQALSNHIEMMMKLNPFVWQHHLDFAHSIAQLSERFPVANVHKAKFTSFVAHFYLNFRLLADAKHFFKSYLKNGKELRNENIINEATNRLLEIDILQDEFNATSAGSSPQANLQIALSFLKKAGVYLQRNAFKQAAPYLVKAIALLESLCQADPDVLEYNQNLADAYSKAALFYLGQGDIKETLFYLEKATPVTTRLAEKYGDVEAVSLQSATAHQKLGDAYQLQGDREKAMDAFQKSLDLLENMNQKKPLHAPITKLLITDYLKIGELYLASERMTDGLAMFEKIESLATQMLQVEPTIELFQQYLTIAHEKFGVTYQAMNDFKKALQHFDKRYALNTEYLQKNPSSNVLKFGMAIACEKLGQLHLYQDKLKIAHGHFVKQIQWMDQLVQDAPQVNQYRHVLAIAHSKMGEIYQAQEDSANAMKHYEKYMRLNTQLVQNAPNAPDFKRSLAVSYAKLGEMFFNQGDLPKSLFYFEKQQVLAEQLIHESAQPVNFAHGLAVAYYHIGRIKKSDGDINVARTFIEKAKSLWESLFQQTNIAMYESNAKVMDEELNSLNKRMPTMKELVAGMDKLK